MKELLDALAKDSKSAPRVDLTKFDIADLIDETLSAYELRDAIGLSANADLVRGFWCKESLRPALENLINNAISYGDGRGILVSASQTHDRMILSVHNIGSPIPKERQQLLFKDFERGDSTRPGWGLGLAFVKQMAEDHGG